MLSGNGTAPLTRAATQADTASDDIWGHLDDRQDEAGLTGEDSTVQISQGTWGDSSITLQVAWSPTCDLNTPEHPDGMCPAARACPSTQQGLPQIRMWRWTRYWDRAAARPLTTWEVVSASCMSGDSPVENVHALVLRLFEDRVKLMKAPLHIQPPNGRTLVNLDTIFWTVDPTRTFGDVPVLGHSVDLRILPTSYTWHFGDGVTSETAIPGAPYPSKDVTHQYVGTGAVRPSLAVTYRGQYRVDGGAWIAMVGRSEERRVG